MTCGLHHQKCSRISVLNSLQYFSRWRRLFVSDLVTRDMIGPNPHSREGSGEHRPVDINALVEESLNLAWHGARAEKQGFEVTLKQSFDSSAGEVDVFPQDITRVFLNLISNGFYATSERGAASTASDYEPTIVASTKNLGDRVEIRIRDNGTGMPPDVKEKMFNPFFTTKPTGEGTGLGLSMCHDIIVKQHAGSIDVDTQPGEFTEIIVTLPRAAVFVSRGCRFSRPRPGAVLWLWPRHALSPQDGRSF